MAGVAAILVIMVFAAFLRFWWATLTPSIPKNWPQGSMWIEAPPAPFDWSPRGDFVGCWLDSQRNVDRCQFADYKGKVSHVGEYTTCDERSPISNQELNIRAADYSKGTFDESTVYGVRLQNGKILIPVSACEARRNSVNPRNENEP
jgi:hypothetical protein